jgi:serine/threonine protein phosphatase 1
MDLPHGRTIAIGDIHGCSKALRTLIDEIAPKPEDAIVFLGDYIDRGPDSRDVIQQLIDLKSRCRVIALLGNHELMMLGVLDGTVPVDLWLHIGGRATVASYGGTMDEIPEGHLEFLHDCRRFHEDSRSIFVHAGYLPTLAMDQQPDQSLFWDHIHGLAPPPHISGKRVYVGHTPQPSGAIADFGYLCCIDTFCFGGKFLTAIDTRTQETWQADIHGQLRPRRWQVLRRMQQWWARTTRDRPQAPLANVDDERLLGNLEMPTKDEALS